MDKKWILPTDLGYLREKQTNEIMSVLHNDMHVILQKVRDDQICHKSNWLRMPAQSGNTDIHWYMFGQYSSDGLYLTAGDNGTLTLQCK